MRISTSVLSIFLLYLLILPERVHGTIIQIGSGATTSSASSVTPFSTLYEDGRHQYIILASELTAAGAVAGPITSLGFNVVGVGSPAMSGFNLKLGATTATSLPGIVTSGLTTYYSSGSGYTSVLGWNTFPFSGSFNWNGTSNILVEVCYDNTSWSTNSTVSVFNVASGRTFGLYDDLVAGCSMTAGSSGAQTVMPQMQLNATTGPSCAVGPVISVSSLPYSVTGASTCGEGNDVSSTAAVSCGSSSYLGGEDQVYVFTPTMSGTHTIALTSSSSWVSLTLYVGCPLTGTCVDFSQSISGIQTIIEPLTAGTTYYLIVDTWPSPTCIFSYDLSITASPFDPCMSITTLSCGSAVSATPSGVGNWALNACGFSTPGQEKIYSFTPTTTGVHNLQVNSVSGGYIDYFFKAASGGCNSSDWTCIDDVNFTGTYPIGTLTAGVQYYILLDPEGTGSYNHNFQIVCPIPVDPCSSITTLACATPVTAALSGDGVWNMYATFPSNSCGFSTPGQEKIYSFTPAVTGPHMLQVTSVTGFYVDYFYKAASDGCSQSGWTCIEDISTASTVTIGTLTAGVQYYILLDAEYTVATSHTFQINCPSAVPTCLSVPSSPSNGASLCLPGPGTLSWPVASGATTYDVYFGTSANPPFVANTSATDYILGALTSGTYYWQIRPRNLSGAAENCPVWSFSVDLTQPMISNCPNNQYVLRNASCVATLPNYTGIPTASDNCPGTVTISQSPMPGTILNGTITVDLIATDAAGNKDTCTFLATPVDQTQPDFICPDNQDVALNTNCQLIVPDLISNLTGSDNCGTVSFSQNPVAGTPVLTSHHGTVNVTITADDGNNNTASCEVTLRGIGQTWYRDADDDEYSNGNTLTQCNRPAGYKLATELIATSGDCDDDDNDRFPSNPEVCDGKDNDCNGMTDDGLSLSIPSGISSTVLTATSVLIDFDDVPDADRYQVRYRVQGTSSWTNSGNFFVSNATITGLLPNHIYQYQVRARCTNANNSAWSATYTFFTNTCFAPTGLAVSNITNNSALVTWNAATGAVSYMIRYRKIGQGWTLTSSATTSKTLTGLMASSNYEVQVSSFCTSGAGPWSASVFFTTASSKSVSLLTGNNSAPDMDWTIFPNPGKSGQALTVELMSSVNEAGVLSIIDLRGSVIFKENWQIARGFNQLTIDCPTVNNGMYFMIIRLSDRMLSKRWIVQ